MKLTPKQKQLVKEYAKSLLSKRITEAAEDFEGPVFDELSALFKKLVPSNGPAETLEEAQSVFTEEGQRKYNIQKVYDAFKGAVANAL